VESAGPQSSGEAIFEIQVPGDLEVGEYANFLAVWHSPHDFTLDFAVTGQAQPNEDGNVSVPCRVVARIKIPPTVAEDMLQALATNVTRYEDVAGPIRKPGETLPPRQSSGGTAQ
jgi:hypothetical protein